MQDEEADALGLTLELATPAALSSVMPVAHEQNNNDNGDNNDDNNEDNTMSSHWAAMEQHILHTRRDANTNNADMRSNNDGDDNDVQASRTRARADDGDAAAANDASDTHDNDDDDDAQHTTDAASMSDAALLRVRHKSQAKQLGSDVYKRWKKLQKRARAAAAADGGDADDADKAGDDDGDDATAAATRRHRHRHRHHRSRHGHRDDDNDDDEAAPRKRSRRDKSSSGRRQRSAQPRATRRRNAAASTTSATDASAVSDAVTATKVADSAATPADVPFTTSTTSSTQRGGAGAHLAGDVLTEHGDGDDHNNNNNNNNNGVSNAARRSAARREQLLQRAAELKNGSSGKPHTVNAKQQAAYAQQMATHVVEAMRTARAKDDLILMRAATNKRAAAATATATAAPLHKIALRDMVEAQCRRHLLLGPLVDAGILQELSYWVYDFARNEPAAFELRTTALDILLRFPLEGELEHAATSRGGSRGGGSDEDLTVFRGLDREHLLRTDVGRAVNALRLHQHELQANRSKCVQLLERFSRAVSGSSGGGSHGTVRARHAAGGDDDDDDDDGRASSAVVSWRCKGDGRVASPFAVVQTSAEALQRALTHPDPRDPTSYHRLLPPRQPVAAITNLSGRLAQEIFYGQQQQQQQQQ